MPLGPPPHDPCVIEILVKDGDQQVPLADYAKREWGDFAASLALGTSGRTVIGQTPIDQSGRSISDSDIRADQDERLQFGV